MCLVRAFLAVPIDRSLQAALARQRERCRRLASGVRWSRPENLHLTLHFFAGLEQETLEAIKASMLSVKRCQRPAEVTVRGLNAFPDWRAPRTLWLGLEPAAPLQRLHACCTDLLRELGVATETRGYTPHLTIGRVRDRGARLAGLRQTFGESAIGTLKVDRLVLFESRLAPGGARHTPLQDVMLDATGRDAL
jgi:2'-5' RNA ligase